MRKPRNSIAGARFSLAAALVLCAGCTRTTALAPSGAGDYSPSALSGTPRTPNLRRQGPALPARTSRFRGASDSRGQKVPRALQLRVNLDFRDTPLLGVIEYFRRTLDANIVLDKTAVEELGGADGLRVSLKLKDVKAKSALSLALQPLGLTWCVWRGVIFVSTPERTAEMKHSGITFFDVRDLLIVPGDMTGAQGE